MESVDHLGFQLQLWLLILLRDVLDGLGLLKAKMLHYMRLKGFRVDIAGKGSLAHRAKLSGLAVRDGLSARRVPNLPSCHGMSAMDK